MEVKPIRNEVEHDLALKAVAPFFDKEPEPGTADADRFEMLLMVIDAYESKRYPMSHASPIEAIKFRMEQEELKPRDLEPMIGQSNRVYEVLSGKRGLTLNMIRRLNKDLGIPAESLIG